MLALQGDVREHLAALRRCGVEAGAVRLPEELASVDALVLPGGESTTMSRLLRAFALEKPLRERLDEGLPCLATCAGLILLSRRILDGRADQLATGTLDIRVRRNAYGGQVESFEADLHVAPLGEPAFPGVFIRAPHIEECGDQVTVLARLDNKPVAIAQGVHLGLTFHPEMSADDRFHELFLRRIETGAVKSAA